MKTYLELHSKVGSEEDLKNEKNMEVGLMLLIDDEFDKAIEDNKIYPIALDKTHEE